MSDFISLDDLMAGLPKEQREKIDRDADELALSMQAARAKEPTMEGLHTQMSTYETDFYAWTQEQAELLRTGRTNEIDLTNMIEEIETMGRSERRALETSMGRLLQHLLKWQFQPMLRSRSWALTIRNQRRELEKILRDNPSLKSKLAEIFSEAYVTARGWAEAETGFSEATFPAHCPWTLEEVIQPDFLPT